MIRRACQETVRQISGSGGYESSIVVEKTCAEKGMTPPAAILR